MNRKKVFIMMKKHFLLVFISLLLVSCNLPQSAPASQVLPSTPSILMQTFTPSQTIVPTNTFTLAPTSTLSATFTLLPSDTPTSTTVSTLTASPTQQNPTAVSKANSSCLFGPNSNYLYLYGLNPGASTEIHGRNADGGWLWVQPTGTSYYCWVATSLVTTSEAIKSIPVVNPSLPTNPAVSPPKGVRATRSGTSVTINWNAAAPALQLAYLVEALVCSKGNLLNVVATTSKLSMTLTDEKTCRYASSGQVRVQNKLGYSTAVTVSWP
jgi:hypothetical protein